MAWPDPSSTPFTRKPTRPPYIPPHRANDAVFPPPPPNTDPSSFHFSNPNHYASPRPRGRGRGGGTYRGGHFNGRQFPRSDDHPPRHHHNPPPPQRFPVEVDNNNDAAGDVANFDAYESVPVEASGENVPSPVGSFAETDLDEDLKRNIERCKYVKPTPVQRHAIPIVAAGRDLMACAQTGSGKTAAFCFPIISGVLKTRSGFSSIPRSDAFVAYPTALILSPTRELSCQIHAEATKFAHQTGVKIVVAYGGASIVKQLQNLEKGVDILVATPGRLVDIIERERVSLSKIKYLALDEADRMLDMGFEQQIRKIVQQMHMPPPGVRQTMLFSATFPTDIQKLAADFLSNYIFLAVGRVGSSTELIAQKIELVQDTDKRNHLANLLCRQRANVDHGKQALTLIFVETKKGADALEIWLSRNGFPSIAIHGDKVQMERERALRSFKRGFTPILVATDVASRGLDIPHVAHVINYDLPRDIADYVHRIGRTGRAGKSGLATAFFSSNKNPPIAKALVEILQEAKQEVPAWLGQFAEGSSSGDRDHGPPRRGRGNFGGRDFRNVTQPAVENYNNYYNTYGNADHYVEPYVTQPDTVYASNNHYDTSYDYNNTNIPNSVYASSNHHYTDPNAEFCGAGRVENGPWGHASVVATGWD